MPQSRVGSCPLLQETDSGHSTIHRGKRGENVTFEWILCMEGICSIMERRWGSQTAHRGGSGTETPATEA